MNSMDDQGRGWMSKIRLENVTLRSQDVTGIFRGICQRGCITSMTILVGKPL